MAVGMERKDALPSAIGKTTMIRRGDIQAEDGAISEPTQPRSRQLRPELRQIAGDCAIRTEDLFDMGK